MLSYWQTQVLFHPDGSDDTNARRSSATGFVRTILDPNFSFNLRADHHGSWSPHFSIELRIRRVIAASWSVRRYHQMPARRKFYSKDALNNAFCSFQVARFTGVERDWSLICEASPNVTCEDHPYNLSLKFSLLKNSTCSGIIHQFVWQARSLPSLHSEKLLIWK